jgi:hypothetical protein
LIGHPAGGPGVFRFRSGPSAGGFRVWASGTNSNVGYRRYKEATSKIATPRRRSGITIEEEAHETS